MTAIQAGAPKVGTLSRLRIQQPVRFFTWPPLALLLVVLVGSVVAAGAWWALAVYLPAWALTAAAVEAARSSTLSPADVVRALRESPRV